MAMNYDFLDCPGLCFLNKFLRMPIKHLKYFRYGQ